MTGGTTLYKTNTVLAERTIVECYTCWCMTKPEGFIKLSSLCLWSLGGSVKKDRIDVKRGICRLIQEVRTLVLE